MSLRSTLLPRSVGALTRPPLTPAVQRSLSTSAVALQRNKRAGSSSEIPPEFIDDLLGVGEDDRSIAHAPGNIPEHSHRKIMRQREVLNYFRLVVHDFPHLEQFQQKYTPPKGDEGLLRFRSVHYQGEAHPAARKSVLTVDVGELFASSHFKDAGNAAKRKFLHLAGSRWIPSSGNYNQGPQVQEVFRQDGKYADVEAPAVGIIKIACERFPFESQNMKWCSDAFDLLLEESKIDTKEIADAPLDLRDAHIREAKKSREGGKYRATIADWPKEWKTPRSSRSAPSQS